MRRRVLLCAILAAAVASAGSAPAGAADRWIERSSDFVGHVNDSIDRGVKWLRGAQQPDGSFRDQIPFAGAMTALAYYTMRVCGVPRDDPSAQRAFDAMRKSYVSTLTPFGGRTYSVALFCMALAEHGEPKPSADKAGERQVTLSDTDTVWMKDMVRFLEEVQDEHGRWSYPYQGRKGDDVYDNSNTQYALLGLKAASRAGVRARTATWLRSLRYLIEAQEDGGPAVPRFEPGEKGRTSARATDRARGWGYRANTAAYGSMTAGGVGSVVICRSELIGAGDYPPGLDAKAEASARDGLAWLGQNFTVTTNPGPKQSMAGPGWHYYYLYALERAGVLANVEWMGERDWYGEGAEYLVQEQLASGAWSPFVGLPGQPGPRVRGAGADDQQATLNTCFALLFLKKGTLPVARGALTKSFDDGDINFAAAAALSDTDFDDFVDLVLSRWRRAGDDDTKERIFARATAVGPRIVRPLVDRLTSTKDPEREAAFALLRRATGLDHGFDPAATGDAREEAVTRWQAWWLTNEKTLRFDAGAGRIVPSQDPR